MLLLEIVPPSSGKYLPSISTVHVSPPLRVPVIIPLPVLNVAPVVKLFVLSSANPVTSTVVPSDFVNVNVWLLSLYVPPVTVTSDNADDISTEYVSPSFLVNVTIPVPPFHVAPVVYSSLYDVRYPSCE